MAKKKKIYFVTGTDTGVGKTEVSCALLLAWRNLNLSTLACKPIASGVDKINGKLINSDVLKLHSAMTESVDLELINPVLIDEPVGPSVYNLHHDKKINFNDLLAQCESLIAHDVDRVLIEGIGGWFVPIDLVFSLPDLIKKLCPEIIIVVGLKLGCINHALLTEAAIRNAGLNIKGWIANQIDPELLYVDEVIQSIQSRIKSPLLAFFPYISTEKSLFFPENIVIDCDI